LFHKSLGHVTAARDHSRFAEGLEYDGPPIHGVAARHLDVLIGSRLEARPVLEGSQILFIETIKHMLRINRR